MSKKKKKESCSLTSLSCGNQKSNRANDNEIEKNPKRKEKFIMYSKNLSLERQEKISELMFFLLPRNNSSPDNE